MRPPSWLGGSGDASFGTDNVYFKMTQNELKDKNNIQCIQYLNKQKIYELNNRTRITLG